MPARTMRLTESNVLTSARATLSTPTIQSPPARADAITEPDPLLSQIRLLGRTLDDLERLRIMSGNRVAAFERDLGLTIDYHDVIVKQLRVAEHIAELELKRAWRKHPLAPWAKETRGVGEKSIARLIAEIGDPAERANPGKLLAYCGHGEALRRRAKGMSQAELFKAGNPRAKKQVWLISTAMLKAGNRDLYDARREATRDRGWTLGHAHADALRIVGKGFLIELWLAARADQVAPDIHARRARAGHHTAEIHLPSARAGGEES